MKNIEDMGEDKKRVFRIATLVLSVLFSLISMHMMLSWQFDLALTVDVVILSHRETLAISILDMLAYADEYSLIAYSIMNIYVIFSILSVLSPRFALVPPFILLLAGYFLSDGYSGSMYSVLRYDLDVSGVLEYATIGFVVMLVVALLANVTMQLYHGKKMHPDLLFNVCPDGIGKDGRNL
ncbi:MAG: hypothetical protein IKQ93_00470 [Candidatus Methanomethylophilaceae archaeon]|nr:hypothetical protein [Candidatus Methanomethylophilaceae archaeon]